MEGAIYRLSRVFVLVITSDYESQRTQFGAGVSNNVHWGQNDKFLCVSTVDVLSFYFIKF